MFICIQIHNHEFKVSPPVVGGLFLCSTFPSNMVPGSRKVAFSAMYLSVVLQKEAKHQTRLMVIYVLACENYNVYLKS